MPFQMQYPRDTVDLANPTRITAWLEAIAAKGYYLGQESEQLGEHYAEDLRNHSLASGISSQVRASIIDFGAGQRNSLECNAYLVGGEFIIQLSLRASGTQPFDGLIFLAVDERHFTFTGTDNGAFSQEKYAWWLSLAEITYDLWHPLYGFQYEGLGGVTIPLATRELALAGKASWLYLVNLFGPEFVLDIGRERLLSAPAWRVQELNDGGIFLAPIPYIDPDTLHRPSPYDMVTVAQYLNIPYQEP